MNINIISVLFAVLFASQTIKTSQKPTNDLSNSSWARELTHYWQAQAMIKRIEEIKNTQQTYRYSTNLNKRLRQQRKLAKALYSAERDLKRLNRDQSEPLAPRRLF